MNSHFPVPNQPIYRHTQYILGSATEFDRSRQKPMGYYDLLNFFAIKKPPTHRLRAFHECMVNEMDKFLRGTWSPVGYKLHHNRH